MSNMKKITLRLDEEDYKTLLSLSKALPKGGVSNLIRTIIKAYLYDLEPIFNVPPYELEEEVSQLKEMIYTQNTIIELITERLKERKII